MHQFLSSLLSSSIFLDSRLSAAIFFWPSISAAREPGVRAPVLRTRSYFSESSVQVQTVALVRGVPGRFPTGRRHTCRYIEFANLDVLRDIRACRSETGGHLLWISTECNLVEEFTWLYLTRCSALQWTKAFGFRG